MAKLKQLVVKVRGLGAPPMDMLRYDRLTPYSGEDAGKMTSQSHDVGEVTLLGWIHGTDGGPSQVTTARWESFCWHVTSISIDGKPQPVYPVRNGRSV